MDSVAVIAARRNYCPIHKTRGTLCPHNLVWDPSCKCHISPAIALQILYERHDKSPPPTPGVKDVR